MTKSYFLKLYQYNAWANKRVLACLTGQQVADKRILTLLGHVVVAETLWLYRIKALPKPALQLWGDFTLEELEKMFSTIDQAWIEYIAMNDRFDAELTYTNYTGDPFVNQVDSIMIHTANHATYHRAQVALLLRDKGYQPVNTDFITYDRVLRGQLKE